MEKLEHELREHIDEELADVHEYHELAKMAEEKGLAKIAHYLNMIAHEEHTHAKYLMNVLDQLGYDPKKV